MLVTSPGVKMRPGEGGGGHMTFLCLLCRDGLNFLSFKNHEIKKKLHFSIRLICSRDYSKFLPGLQQRKTLARS